MTYLYTARARFDNDNGGDVIAWTNYIQWSKLTHLTELVSVDTSLNEELVEPDRTSEKDWEEIVIDNYHETGFYRTLDYVLRKTSDVKRFNLLAVVIEPETDCSLIRLDNYDFIGYDLIDQYYTTGALTNCGGFDETFLPCDLNHFGLIDNFTQAYAIKKRLKENNPQEEHADSNVIAVWRHCMVGR